MKKLSFFARSQYRQKYCAKFVLTAPCNQWYVFTETFIYNLKRRGAKHAGIKADQRR